MQDNWKMNYEDWDLYWAELRITGKRKADYIPSPDDIFRRLHEMKWLEENGFSSRFQDSVMYHNQPSIHRVVYMRQTLGMRTSEIEEELHGQLRPIRKS